MEMTDLAFKGFLKQMVSALERVERQETKEAILLEIAKLKKDLEDDIRS